MNLKTFNTTNVASQRRGKATIRIHLKSGIFAFSKDAVEKMSLTNESSIEFHQDEQRPKDWYMSIDTSGEGFKVRQKGSAEQFQFNSTGMANEIFKSIEFDKPSGSMLIGERIPNEGSRNRDQSLYPIITSSIS